MSSRDRYWRARARRIGVALAVVALPLATSASIHGTQPARAATPRCSWMDPSWSPAHRAKTLLNAMTLDQKIQMVHGAGAVENKPNENGPINYADFAAAPGGRGVGWVPAITSLCIPPLYMSDGGQGYATTNGANARGATAFPSGIAQASSFDPQTAYTYGRALARQWMAKGSNVLLGPDVNAGRNPSFSRNWEGIGGEDPYLQGTMAAGMITGVQSRPVIATVKHYAALDAGSLTAVVDQRTLHEVYEKPFENAVQAGVGSVMCAYTKLNDQFACQNPDLLSTLKSELGFSGYVVSDWGATHSTVPSATAGLDMEMAAGSYFDAFLKSAVRSGQVPISRLDDMVYRILNTMFQRGLFDRPPGPVHDLVNTAFDETLARKMSQEGTVLLKNRASTLPVKDRNSTIAVIGLPASQSGAATYYQSTSSPDSQVIPTNLSAPIDAITKRAKKNNDTVVYDPGAVPGMSAFVASTAKVAVVFVYTNEGEFAGDRTSFTLPNNQDALVQAVAAANPNTVVVVNSGGPVTMPWLDSVRGVVEAWMPGEQDGNAIAGILFGDAEPGGRLPETFPVKYSDEPAPTDEYSEGLYTGYRGFDKNRTTPLFPFGYGLSYTKFAYSSLHVPARTSGTAPTKVSLTVRNVGSRAGSDVPQIYVGWPRTADVREPVRQLRGYQRVELPAGVGARVTISLDPRAFSYWNPTSKRWTVQPGCYPIWAGPNEADMQLPGQIAVGGARC